jgi:hypothetical protein
MSKKDQSLIMTVLIVVAMVAGGLWLLISAMSLQALRAWGIITAFLLPICIWFGWWIGTRDSRAHVSGLHKGIGAVMSAAGKTADLRTTAAGRVRATTTTINQPALPSPRVVHLSAGTQDEEIIDL